MRLQSSGYEQKCKGRKDNHKDWKTNNQKRGRLGFSKSGNGRNRNRNSERRNMDGGNGSGNGKNSKKGPLIVR